MTAAPLVFRYRVRFAKVGVMRWTGHLDLQRNWERTMIRAELPLAYSRGFNKRPRMVFASVLPLGFTSDCELVDIWLAEHRSADSVTQNLQGACPPGIEVHQVTEIDTRAKAVTTEVKAARFVVRHCDGASLAGLADAVATLLATESIMRERRGKPYDLRHLLRSLSLVEQDQALAMELLAQQGATGRPEEVLDQLGQDAGDYLIHRTELLSE